MSRKLTVFCILAVALAFCVPAFAEVQNVKVSGDLTVRALYRGNYDLDSHAGTSSTAVANNTPKGQNFFMESVGLNVDADLTDNVSTTVRLVNQRDWNNNSAGANTFTVDTDLAYVKLKEMVYAPLTLTIGRQDLWYGRGLVIGTMLQPVTDVGGYARTAGTTDAGTTTRSSDFNNSITAKEYSETTAFDAIKATIDLAPWKMDLLFSQIDENAVSLNDDTLLYGVNLGYKFDVYNGEAEAYYFGKVDKAHSARIVTGVTADADRMTIGRNEVNTYGLRGSLEPITNLTLGAEGALQYGDYADVRSERNIRAYAFDAFGKYSFADVMWKPALGLEWLMLSGEKDPNSSQGNKAKYRGWDPMYRGKFDTAIRDFQNYLYFTRARMAANASDSPWSQDSGMTNQNSLLVKGSITPLKDVNLEGTYAHFWFNTKLNTANRGDYKTGSNIGDELDLLLTYDYTEDVSFGLLGGFFFPGSVFPSGKNDTASDIVGSMKVVF